MLQDLFKSHDNAEELIKKEFGKDERGYELLDLIKDSIDKSGLDEFHAEEAKSRMVNFFANVLEKKFNNEKDFLKFTNDTIKELEKEKKIDSWQLATLSFILGAVMISKWIKNFSHNKQETRI